ncbi:triose-phosphate transporter family-domain-containing protein [Cyathus striatus]|nr:triose-phosphate transporter family-domain-containing protein [Cyathus striatus]
MHSPVWTAQPKSWAHFVVSRIQSTVAQFGSASNRRSSRSSLVSSKPSLSLPPANSSNLLFILLCSLWYTTSALSSNTGKAIMTQFRYPITLTFIQFGFVAFYCLLFMTPLIRFSTIRRPTKAIIRSTLPMGMFQVGGHMFSSIAISRIPVSTVHTIKALSPLFTVAAYALLFGVSYSSKTYASLLPLTFGVMLACSFDVSASNFVGLLCAFGSALVFVSSNIFFKKIMPSNSSGSSSHSSHKLDKLNLLLYSSGMAFLLMIPIWMYYDLPLFLAARSNPDHIIHPIHGHAVPHSVTYYFFMNGTVHFAQNIIAFIILSSTSPVTYSIASLIKRVAVICIAIVWFNQSVHPVQAFGIVMTFTGLYMYNNAKGDVEKGEKKMRRVEAARDLMLPTTKEDSRFMSGVDTPPEIEPVFESVEASGTGLNSATVYGRQRGMSISMPPPMGMEQHAFTHYHQAHHRTHVPANNLHIHTIPLDAGVAEKKEARIGSPVDSYPSPPPSLDSPPLDNVTLPPFGVTKGTVVAA